MRNREVFKIDSKVYDVISELINRKFEGDYWAYKQEWQSDNEHLLHDILCFANTVHNKDCYLIIGVSDIGDVTGLTDSSSNRKNQAYVIDMLADLKFAGAVVPEVAVETIVVNKKEVDVLTVFNSVNVPFYLESVPKEYKRFINGYIYSRKNDKNTPINENSIMPQIEILWKKRLALVNSPLKQILSRMKNKLEWYEIGDTYYNIFVSDFKIKKEKIKVKRRNYEGPFYLYNQVNKKTSYMNLSILYRETVLKEFKVIVLDVGRYQTPNPMLGIIKNPNQYSEQRFFYKYLLKDSFDYALQQFIYDEDNKKTIIAKNRFDEVVLYFENEQERQDFNQTIESDLECVERYINDEKLRKFDISFKNAHNEKYWRDYCRDGLVMGFGLKKFLNDYRRKKAGINIKRIKSFSIITTSQAMQDIYSISRHIIEIEENGDVKQFLYNRVAEDNLTETLSYKADKYQVRSLFNFIEPITTKWVKDYSVMAYDGSDWQLTLKYDDGTCKVIKGTVELAPYAEDIAIKISKLVKFKEEPWLFYALSCSGYYVV